VATREVQSRRPPGKSLQKKPARVPAPLRSSARIPTKKGSRVNASLRNCLHCGRLFPARRRGHVFCSSRCRYSGELPPHKRPSPEDHEQIERLFDPRRDPSERVREDDWNPSTEWQTLDRLDDLETRRCWYLSLLEAE
jgi:hypothetical protein